MNRTSKEKKLLQKLGISDFRYLTKDKVISLASMLPEMDRDVAKAAIEQFPNFKEFSLAIVDCYKTALDNVFQENRANQDAFYDVCRGIIESLQRELEQDNITAEDRSRIEDKMLTVAQMISDKDSENKRFLQSNIIYFVISCVFLSYLVQGYWVLIVQYAVILVMMTFLMLLIHKGFDFCFPVLSADIRIWVTVWVSVISTKIG